MTARRRKHIARSCRSAGKGKKIPSGGAVMMSRSEGKFRTYNITTLPSICICSNMSSISMISSQISKVNAFQSFLVSSSWH
ncbi:hypothetical protein I7I53_10362 [Histoplasma capsulatum var. duboisii H88]|uniref:Uncharacterized protein n=1 Tax=Ajellomyces capsulatus (strain H88) TaxID=544711 RepID=A0A8A1LCW8_AJEC8|nr:hypothetical protein I7I53_10362 [Histoplasma capsulatum var. duboisii H88]